METKQTINFNISDPKVADKFIAYLREQKACDDDKILRKLALMDKKLEGLGAIVVRLTQMETDAAMANAAREAKSIIDEVSASLNVFTPGS